MKTDKVTYPSISIQRFLSFFHSILQVTLYQDQVITIECCVVNQTSKSEAECIQQRMFTSVNKKKKLKHRQYY